VGEGGEIEHREIEPGEGKCPDDVRFPLTRFAASPLSTLSHEGRGKKHFSSV
jgi:hypothetical protein